MDGYISKPAKLSEIAAVISGLSQATAGPAASGAR
jgi:hypothetical protein